MSGRFRIARHEGDAGHNGAGVGGGRVNRPRRDAELARDGWERRFVGSPPRLQDAIELYESLGLEVLSDPVSEEESREECAGCELALTFFRVLYTRRSG